jgi:hypothetical protein
MLASVFWKFEPVDTKIVVSVFAEAVGPVVTILYPFKINEPEGISAKLAKLALDKVTEAVVAS